MVLWLLNHFSTVGLILLIMGGTTALAVAGCLIVQRACPKLGESELEKGAEAMRGAFTVLFGLILGLSIAGVSARFSEAQSAVASEASVLAQLVRANRALPPDEQSAINPAIAQYDHAVVDDEWVTMRNGQESPRAAAALDNLYTAYQQHTPSPGSVLAPASKLDQLTTARRTRLQDAESGLPGLLRILLTIGMVLFIIVWYPAKISDQRLQVVVVGCIAAFISFAFLLTILLDTPSRATLWSVTRRSGRVHWLFSGPTHKVGWW